MGEEMKEIDETFKEIAEIYGMFNDILMMKLKADDILHQMMEGDEKHRNKLLAVVIKAGAMNSAGTLFEYHKLKFDDKFEDTAFPNIITMPVFEGEPKTREEAINKGSLFASMTWTGDVGPYDKHKKECIEAELEKLKEAK